MRRRRETAVETSEASIPLEVAHERFGGVDLGASLAGMVVGMGTLVLLGTLVATLGTTIGLPGGVGARQAAIGVLVTGALMVLIAFLAGGWAAGRMARYDGPVNGLMTGIWALLLLAVAALFGAWMTREYDLVPVVTVPEAAWTAGDAATLAVVVVGGIALMLAGGSLGGLLGTRYHRAADRAIVTATEELRAGARLAAEARPVEPPTARPDEELLDRRKRLAPPADEAERRELAEIDEELRLRGYEPQRSGSSGA